MLLENKANPIQPTKSGFYPIVFCFSRLEDDQYKYENTMLCMLMIDILLQYGADLNIKIDSSDSTILSKLLSEEITKDEQYQNTSKLLKFLIERGADKTVLYKDKPLSACLKEGPYKNDIIECLNSSVQTFFYQKKNKNSFISKRTITNDSNFIIMENNSSRENCCIIF